MLAGLLCFAVAPARAQIVTVIANANFENIEDFYATFAWDATTDEVVPGTMDFSSTGPLGALDFTGGNGEVFAWTSTSTPYFIQLDFGEDANGHMLPDPGAYPGGDLILICNTSECNDHNTFGFYGHVFCGADPGPCSNSSGSVTVVPFPEPSELMYFLTYLVAVLAFLKRKRIQDSARAR
jgi:hypothetical protein